MSKQSNSKLKETKSHYDISARINELCNEKNLDYSTLSKKSGVPLTTLMNIAKGNSKNPGIFTIGKLCTGFEITLSDFFSN